MPKAEITSIVLFGLAGLAFAGALLIWRSERWWIKKSPVLDGGFYSPRAKELRRDKWDCFVFGLIFLGFAIFATIHG